MFYILYILCKRNPRDITEFENKYKIKSIMNRTCLAYSTSLLACQMEYNQARKTQYNHCVLKEVQFCVLLKLFYSVKKP